MGKQNVNGKSYNAKNAFLQLLRIILAGLLALAPLSLFTYYYDYAAVSEKDPLGVSDKRQPPGSLRSVCSEGFAWNIIDENGFNNLPMPKGAKIDLLLMGTSHIEGFYVAKDELVVSRLNQIAVDNDKEFYAYSIAKSAHHLYAQAYYLETAAEYFKPESFIVAETPMLDLSLETMKGILKDEYTPFGTTAPEKLQMLLKIPAVKLIGNQLIMLKNRNDEAKTFVKPYEETILSEDYISTLNKFIGKMALDTADAGCKLMIVFHPKFAFENGGETAKSDTDPAYLSAFASACEKNNVVFIDTTEEFLQSVNLNHEFPVGFTNSKATSGHINKLGHEIIARAIYEACEAESQ